MRLRSYLLSIALLIMPLPLLGDTVYTYTGNHFNTFEFGPTSYSTTADFISVSFELPNLLPTILPSEYIYPTIYSVSDGVESFNQTTLSPIHVGIIVSTDASGNINFWDIVFETGRDVYTYWDPVPAGEEGSPVGEDGSIEGFGTGGRVLNSPGIWTSSSTITAVPEPRPLFLLGSGALGMIGAIRGKLGGPLKTNLGSCD